MATHLEPETEPVERGFEVAGVIDENRRLGNRHLLVEFSQKQQGSFGSSLTTEHEGEQKTVAIGRISLHLDRD